MTLAERRILHEFETNQFPGLKKRVEEAAGFAVSLEVQWDTLAAPGESHLYTDSWPQVYFEPLIGALKHVTRDDMGREAIGASLKKIAIQNTKGCYYGDCWATFQNGILTLDHEPITNVSDKDARQAGLIAVLEKAL